MYDIKTEHELYEAVDFKKLLDHPAQPTYDINGEPLRTPTDEEFEDIFKNIGEWCREEMKNVIYESVMNPLKLDIFGKE